MLKDLPQSEVRVEDAIEQILKPRGYKPRWDGIQPGPLEEFEVDEQWEPLAQDHSKENRLVQCQVLSRESMNIRSAVMLDKEQETHLKSRRVGT
ncbi:hypothetical protein DUI87_06778 [Hirundo rustica rustica]|uniref:Uncharacterized protein n=1 Tax=Hirundo rustica rustica TaxID=333673 RepID=A0A3M0KT41_HIRRU|nr:hypothetical protein DUI87_06778 [Hirundo rustica rustica]